MKFSRLKVGDQFVLSQKNQRVFEKVKLKKATCCTPQYNAICASKTTKRKMSAKFFKSSTEVIKRIDKKEENITLGSSPINTKEAKMAEKNEELQAELEALVEQANEIRDREEEDIMIFGQYMGAAKESTPKVNTNKRPYSEPVRKRLSQLEPNAIFWYEDNKYTHSIRNRSGGGKVAVKNVKTGKEEYLPATIFCEVYEDDTVDFSELDNIDID